ncbi:MAG: hypothetical protein KF761_04075 [Salinibacterium sp.]|nr:hypothetical protein [Salinibacterium sp.]
MPEHVGTWWARRQWSKAASVPYPVGSYREFWETYPVLVNQFHPDLNNGIVLSQVPPAADVWLLWQCDVGHLFVATPSEQRLRPGGSRRRSTWCPDCSVLAGAGAPAKPRTTLCVKSIAEHYAVGEAFHSECAPRPASAAEDLLRQKLVTRLPLAHSNALRVPRPFFTHLEVWPDILLPDLRVAIEYDTTGRDGLEHVGKRELVDNRKDRLVRAANWEVVRVRMGKLKAIGPYDVEGGARTVDRVLDRLREIRGDLIVNAWLA